MAARMKAHRPVNSSRVRFGADAGAETAVSYTHLTLPTIYSV